MNLNGTLKHSKIKDWKGCHT